MSGIIKQLRIEIFEGYVLNGIMVLFIKGEYEFLLSSENMQDIEV